MTRQNALKLLKIHEKNHQILLEQVAHFGPAYAPPHLLTQLEMEAAEIASLQQELGLLESALSEHAPPGLRDSVVPTQMIINNFERSVFTNAVIGPGGRFVNSSPAAADPQAPHSENSPRGGEMSNFTFNNNQMTNNVIGDYGTFNQNVQNMSIEQIESELKRAQTRASQEASTEEEKADAKNISDAATEAVKGNKGKVAESLYKVGKWGWKILKEVGCSLVVETLKQSTGL